MYKNLGNCLTFAIKDFIKNGGILCMELWPKHRVPHFSVQRGLFRYDFDIVTMILKEFWYWGESRITPVEIMDNKPCKRFRIAKRHIVNRG